jgi:hypothetical protein
MEERTKIEADVRFCDTGLIGAEVLFKKVCASGPMRSTIRVWRGAVAASLSAA